LGYSESVIRDDERHIHSIVKFFKELNRLFFRFVDLIDTKRRKKTIS
jgi:hypothetical protein